MIAARAEKAALAIDWSGLGVCGLTVVATVAVASSRGGYFPETWAWVAVLTLVPAVLLLIARGGLHISKFQLALPGLLLAYGALALASSWWSVSPTRSILEAQRALAYVGITLLAALIVRRRTAPHLVAGLLAGVSVVAGYAFLTRVLPDRFTRFESIAGYRLNDPVGYWNGLGIFAVMGILLALGVAARARSRLACGVAAMCPVVLAATMFFTFSRGAWVALAAGLAIAVVVDPRRLQLLAMTAVLAPWSAVAVYVCSRAEALTTIGSGLPEATDEGRAVLVAVAALSVGSGLSGLAFAELSRRVEVGATARRVAWVLLIAGALAGLAAWSLAGSPVSTASRAWDRFHTEQEEPPTELTDRLFSLSAGPRPDLWKTAREDFAAHPLAGTGAGTFAFSWAEQRETASNAKDAHSLYLETLAELGIVGLLLVAGVFALGTWAGVRARRTSIFAGAFGAFAAYALHAGIDWDWELVGVTMVPVLALSALVAAGEKDEPEPVRPAMTVGLSMVALVLSVLALISALGNVPLGRARGALEEERATAALADARKARRWAPWSSEALRFFGEAQLSRRRLSEARATFRDALEKDPRNWELWVDLALASTGDERRTAILRAARLNPKSTQVRQLLETL